ncbi:unnamed protein product [Phytophthora fragariaefolia]|uniref:Unnamed protein product n=1 Tax=Phytophthora fragariaefolia TaxID=1490495 RepID=A0A9W6Y9M9_9STRA|nr:unnamed protein product [Phytophthora fragariaefolia]
MTLAVAGCRWFASCDRFRRHVTILGPITRDGYNNGVVEPQVDDRLRAHMTVYGSNYTPMQLSRLVECSQLQSAVAEWFDGISLNRISVEARTWEEEWKKRSNHPLPCACEIMVPNEKREFWMPLKIKVVNQEKGKRVKFSYQPVDDILDKQLDNGYSPENPTLLLKLVILLSGKNQDSMFVENNIGLAAFTASHTNSSVTNGEDAGTAVEKYQLAYMTKEGAELKKKRSCHVTALEHISKFPSTAADSGSTSRTAKYLATPHNTSANQADNINPSLDELLDDSNDEEMAEDEGNDRLLTEQLPKLSNLVNTENYSNNLKRMEQGVHENITPTEKSYLYHSPNRVKGLILVLNIPFSSLIKDLSELSFIQRHLEGLHHHQYDGKMEHRKRLSLLLHVIIHAMGLSTTRPMLEPNRFGLANGTDPIVR